MSSKVDSVLISIITAGCTHSQTHMLHCTIATQTHTHALTHSHSHTLMSMRSQTKAALLHGFCEGYGVVFPVDLGCE